MNRLRWRLARWLVGPFTRLPADDGVYIVTNAGRVQSIITAETFELTVSSNLDLTRFSNGPGDFRYEPHHRKGVFSGTVA